MLSFRNRKRTSGKGNWGACEAFEEREILSSLLSELAMEEILSSMIISMLVNISFSTLKIVQKNVLKVEFIKSTWFTRFSTKVLELFLISFELVFLMQARQNHHRHGFTEITVRVSENRETVRHGTWYIWRHNWHSIVSLESTSMEHLRHVFERGIGSSI